MNDQIPDDDRAPTTWSDATPSDDESTSKREGSVSTVESGGPDGAAARYRADSFQVLLPGKGWADETLFILQGPVRDGLPHRLTIARIDGPVSSSVEQVADEQVPAVTATFSASEVLEKKTLRLECGVAAQRVSVTWTPVDRSRHLEQWYVRAASGAYVLSACFTPTTRPALAPQVERMVRTFDPSPPQP
jgi:hypothetical protein